MYTALVIYVHSYTQIKKKESNLLWLSKGAVITENSVQAEFVFNTLVTEVHTLSNVSLIWQRICDGSSSSYHYKSSYVPLGLLSSLFIQRLIFSP